MLVKAVNETEPKIFRCGICMRRIKVAHNARPFGWVLFEKYNGSCECCLDSRTYSLNFRALGRRTPRMDVVSSSKLIPSGLQQAKYKIQSQKGLEFWYFTFIHLFQDVHKKCHILVPRMVGLCYISQSVIHLLEAEREVWC